MDDSGTKWPVFGIIEDILKSIRDRAIPGLDEPQPLTWGDWQWKLVLELY